MDINDRISHRIRALREARRWSLETLAERSGVSRSNISLIERGESNPTATVLDKLSAALGVTLASLFEVPTVSEGASSPIARVAEQPVWTDPASGYARRNVSPAAPSPVQLVDVVFPAGQRVAYEAVARDNEVHQQVWMIDGALEISVGDVVWQLTAGDCLAMHLDEPIVYRNPGTTPARYLVALVTLPYLPARRST
ncbi:XRE family transcriptional regulator [uncultured Piscinibacter sp.]|uniref:helix-turn-helix domain-containing protein n=1 Tax=uncultured Piscinibacter sp. TaxID=1131835 RepID=UPI00262404A6|nr:XRE family transcriptional regulator [uncultured Piscinibacter sp.]